MEALIPARSGFQASLPDPASFDWTEHYGELLGGLAVLSVVTFFGSLILLPFLINRLPEDYFASNRAATPPGNRSHFKRGSLWFLRNALGALLALAGLLMLFLPGQGILTLMGAVVLLDFPGKRRLERSLVRRPKVLAAFNWFRKRGRKPPLIAPQPKSHRAPEEATRT